MYYCQEPLASDFTTISDLRSMTFTTEADASFPASYSIQPTTSNQFVDLSGSVPVVSATSDYSLIHLYTCPQTTRHNAQAQLPQWHVPRPSGHHHRQRPRHRSRMRQTIRQ